MTQRFYESMIGDLIGDKRIKETVIGDNRINEAKKLGDEKVVHINHLVYAVGKALNNEPSDEFLKDGQNALKILYPEFYNSQVKKSSAYKAINESEGFRVNI
jgi:hypothetical protein